MLIGVAFITTGFFVGHATASSSVGAMAEKNKGHGSSLYLLFYYMGSSLTGFTGGLFCQHAGWRGVVGFTAFLALQGIILVLIQISVYNRIHKDRKIHAPLN